MTSEWTIAESGQRAADRGRSVAHSRDRDHGYDGAVAMAYREVLPDIPADLLHLLAKLN